MVRRSASLLLLILALLMVVPVFGVSREYELKAGFIYNFLKFIEFPGAKTTLYVGILGQDPFEGYLQRMSARTAQGKKIVVKNLSSAKEAKAMDVLFLARSEASNQDSVLALLKGSSVLTISDIPGFTRQGGAILLTEDGGRIRFTINVENLQNANLKASSELLQMATVIR